MGLVKKSCSRCGANCLHLKRLYMRSRHVFVGVGWFCEECLNLEIDHPSKRKGGLSMEGEGLW